VCLIGVSDTRHTTHHTENVVVHGIHTDLGSGGTRNSAGRENELENSVVNAREVARAGGLVLLRAKSEGVDVNTRVGGAGVVLEGLDNIKVVALTLREAILAVKLELSGDDRVLTPAVHIEGSLGEDESAGIGDVGLRDRGAIKTRVGAGSPLLSRCETTVLNGDIGRLAGFSINYIVDTSISGTGHLEETVGGNEAVGAGYLVGSTESMDRIGEGVDGIGVVEGLGTEALVENLGSI